MTLDDEATVTAATVLALLSAVLIGYRAMRASALRRRKSQLRCEQDRLRSKDT